MMQEQTEDPYDAYNKRFTEEQREEISKVIMLLDAKDHAQKLYELVPNNKPSKKYGYDNSWANLYVS